MGLDFSFFFFVVASFTHIVSIHFKTIVHLVLFFEHSQRGNRFSTIRLDMQQAMLLKSTFLMVRVFSCFPSVAGLVQFNRLAGNLINLSPLLAFDSYGFRDRGLVLPNPPPLALRNRHRYHDYSH